MSLTDRDSNPVVAGDELVVIGKVIGDAGNNRAVVEIGGKVCPVDTGECLLATSLGGGSSDHGALKGLGDDDHPQYHTDARGDARYDALGAATSAISGHEATGDPHTQYARRSSNLSDLTSASDARTNLGLGGLATKSTVATADIDAGAVTYAKMQNVSATDRVLGRSTAGAGSIEEITFTAAARSLCDDTSTAAMRTTLGLGTAATVNTGTGASDVPTITHADGRYPRVLARTLDTAAVASSTSETTLCDLTVPAGTLGTTGCVELVIQGYVQNSSGSTVNYTVRVYWGGTIYWGDVFGVATGTVHRPFELRLRVQALSATNKQSVRGVMWVGSSAAGSVAGLGNFGAAEPNNPFSHDSSTTYPNKDSTAAQNVKVTMQMGTNNANARFKVDSATLSFIP